MKTVLAVAWFGSCVNSALAVTEYYYMSIYFQSIKGFTPSRAGIMLTPMLVGIAIGNLCGGAGIIWLGYYTPFMFATTLLAPVASGLLTTIKLDQSLAKVLCLLALLGFGCGVGISAPIISLQTILKEKDLPIGLAVSGFGQTIGSAIWIVVSATLFQTRLTAELDKYSPSVNPTTLDKAGVSDILSFVGGERLHEVLMGYDKAVVQTLYLPLALTVATIFASAFMEWRSVKQHTS